MPNILTKSTLFTLLLITLSGCFGGGGGGSNRSSWQKNPVDNYIRDLSAEPSFSIILYDMDVQGNFVKTYLHQYRIVTTGVDSLPVVETTDWEQVSEEFFFAHENDMGMEIAAKGPDGEVSKVASPAGYSNYVGNENYGRWRTDNSGNSFWEFYGKYRLLSDVFYMVGGGPIYRRGYYDYRDNYYGRRSYYGGVTSSGNPRYGTNSDFNRQTRPNFFERRASKNGFSRSTRSTSSSRSTASRSSGSRSSSTRSSSSSSSRSSRTTRSSSRYGGRSSRSRG
ncbi:MAG TPA: hypothetical protein DCR93_24475, partial [Cytophagales bacterium]|nr:hypothetical protein [Cytophagales bacterium]